MAEKFRLETPQPDLSEWDRVVEGLKHQDDQVTVAMVGKYMDLIDAYKSLNEALMHAGIHTATKLNIRYLDSEDIETDGVGLLSDVDAILVPGGFGKRGTEGKIAAIQYARENNVPYLGICLGMQVALIEYARNVAEMEAAHSTEFNPNTPNPVVGLITEWIDESGNVETRTEDSDLGGTMRVGCQLCHLVKGSKVHDMYGSDTIYERHRHRYEVNNNLLPQIEKAGLKVTGLSADKKLVEIIENPNHPWFVAAQFHPEFTSTPRDGHPLFEGFIKAAREYQNREDK